MQSPQSHRLLLHIATFCVWLLVAFSATYWLLPLKEGKTQENFLSVAESTADSIDTASLVRLLGAIAPQATAEVRASNRFALKGIVAGAPGKEAALISIDNKPAVTFKVGSTVEDGMVLQSATARKVTLLKNRGESAVMTLEMPLLDK